MTFMPALGFPTPYPRGRLSGTRKSENEGKRRSKYQTKGCTEKTSCYPTKRVIVDANFPTIPECFDRALGKDLSTTPFHTIKTLTQNKHIHQ